MVETKVEMKVVKMVERKVDVMAEISAVQKAEKMVDWKVEKKATYVAAC